MTDSTQEAASMKITRGLHHATITIDEYGTDFTFSCPLPDDAFCHFQCDGDCEQWGPDHDGDMIAEAKGTEREPCKLVNAGHCIVIENLEAMDWTESFTGNPFTVKVEIEDEFGDRQTFSIVGNAADAELTTTRQVLLEAQRERDEARLSAGVRFDCWKAAEAQLERVAELIRETSAEGAASIWPRLNDLLDGEA